MRRLFGDRFESEITLAPPGMEIGTQHKYLFDILLDYKPEAAMLRPKAVESLRRFAAKPRSRQCLYRRVRFSDGWSAF